MSANSDAWLLRRLVSYAPRPHRTAVEDFTTEVLAHLCLIDRGVRESLWRLFVESPPPAEANVLTQVSRTDESGAQVRFDLLIGGPLGKKPALILENKIDADFSRSDLTDWQDDQETDAPPTAGAADESEHQLDKYLRVTADYAEPPLIGSITKYPDAFRPKAWASRWVGNRTWADVRREFERRTEHDCSANVAYLIAEFVNLLSSTGGIVEKIDGTVFRPNPGRPGIADLFKAVGAQALEVVSGPWKLGKVSTSPYYIYLQLLCNGNEAIGLMFSDTRGEIAVVVNNTWLDGHPGVEPEGFTKQANENLGWYARKLSSERLAEAKTYEEQLASVASELIDAMHQVRCE